MSAKPQVILSGFADEAANDKTSDQQFAAFAAMGLDYYSVRFVNTGSAVKNVMQLTRSEIRTIMRKQDEYGLKVATFGSPIGKVKLLDEDDGTSNRFVPFKSYLANDVKPACELASAFETKLLRGFSFYHPRGSDPQSHLACAVDRLGRIAEVCDEYGLVFGIEVEANLVGQSGPLLAEIHRHYCPVTSRIIAIGYVPPQ